jgi:hypothetical protein
LFRFIRVETTTEPSNIPRSAQKRKGHKKRQVDTASETDQWMGGGTTNAEQLMGTGGQLIREIMSSERKKIQESKNDERRDDKQDQFSNGVGGSRKDTAREVEAVVCVITWFPELRMES